MATKQQMVKQILRIAKQKNAAGIPPQSVLIGLPQGVLSRVIEKVQGDARKKQQAKGQQKKQQAKVQQRKQQAKVQQRKQQAKVQGKKAINFLSFRAKAKKAGLTDSQIKAAYQTHKAGASAQQAIAAHSTPASQARAQAKAQQVKAQVKQQIKVQVKAQKPSGRKNKPRKDKVGKAAAARAQKIKAAIASGKISVKQGKASPDDYQGTAKQRNAKFLALYKGARVKGRKKSGESLVSTYNSMEPPKHPYYLYPGYTVQVHAGGGESGAGIIRKIPGVDGIPFNHLSAAEKKEVIRFLASAKGAKLRSSTAANKQANVQKLISMKAAG